MSDTRKLQKLDKITFKKMIDVCLKENFFILCFFKFIYFSKPFVKKYSKLQINELSQTYATIILKSFKFSSPLKTVCSSTSTSILM